MEREPSEDLKVCIRKLRAYSNRGKYREACQLAKRYRKTYPDELIFAYYEAVMFGDDTKGRSPKSVSIRHKKSARMLRDLLRQMRSVPPLLRFDVRNEYYWFSHQPYKQYLLGIEGVSKGDRHSYYSQGVGAAQMALKYFQSKKVGLALRWCKKSEASWKQFFKADAKWYNAYCWYAQVLGFLQRPHEMEAALRKAAQIAKRPRNYFVFEDVRREVSKILKIHRTQRTK